MSALSWDDLRFVLAVAKAGSLARAASVLHVDHTTVGRRVEAAERALGVRLFTRTTTGLVRTADADKLLASMQRVEEAVLAVERTAQPARERLEGPVRVTSPETFGVAYLAPKLAAFGAAHPGLTIELVPAGEVLDLGRRQAEIAVRMFRSKGASLLVRKVADIGYGLYATDAYLARRLLKNCDALADHTILGAPGADDVDSAWLKRLNPRAKPAFVSPVSLALLSAAKASAGVAVLPRYLGDAEPALRHIELSDADSEPTEPVYLTVHNDLKRTPRVRVLLDFLAATLKDDAALLRGK